MTWIQDDARDVTDGGGLKPSTLIHFVCYSALIFGVLFIAKQYVGEAVGRARSEASQEAEKRVRSEVESQRKAALAPIQQDMKQAITPEKAKPFIPKYFPDVPLNVPTFVTPIDGKVPDAPQGQHYTVVSDGDLVLPKEGDVALVQAGGKCAEDAVNLKSCSQEKASLERDKKTLQEQVAGGSRWHRLKHAGKCVLVTSLASGAAAYVAKNRPVGALVGAAAGSAACALFQ